ncbi:MAG: DMT family transporter [Chitinophagaceae bacterium]|nr:MAG: DMT family transporter [Chitinophagaceae bacterium]
MLKHNPGKAALFMIIATISATIMQVCVKFLAHIPVVELIFFRSIISLLLSGSYIIRNRIPVWGNNKKLLVIRALAGVFALTLFFLTLQKLPLASAITLQYLSPFFSVLLGRFILKEKFKKLQLFFFLMAIFGIAIMGAFDERIPFIYAVMGVVAAFFAGLAYNFIRLLGKTDHPMTAVFYFPLLATPVMAIPTYLQWVTPSLTDIFWIIGMGVFTQFLQYYTAKSVQSDTLSQVTIIKYLGIVFGITAGWFIFNESLSMENIAGITIVTIAVIGNYFFVTQKKIKPE